MAPAKLPESPKKAKVTKGNRSFEDSIPSGKGLKYARHLQSTLHKERVIPMCKHSCNGKLDAFSWLLLASLALVHAWISEGHQIRMMVRSV
jgi:hypothetical protein